jgi:hypothetical protein
MKKVLKLVCLIAETSFLFWQAGRLLWQEGHNQLTDNSIDHILEMILIIIIVKGLVSIFWERRKAS